MARPIVIVGPIGSGKSTLARYLHAESRSRGAMVTVSAGSLDDSLFASTLFGHVQGAFTGALRAREGALTAARWGTLFLDDLALLSPAVQAALLRLLEERRFRPVGADTDERVRCRLVFASTATPQELAAEGKLLPDLPSRLGELEIRLLPLRARLGELEALATYFARKMMSEAGTPSDVAVEFSEEALVYLRAYDWPGNFRELKNVCERAVIVSTISDGVQRIGVAHLPDRLRQIEDSGPASASLTPAIVRAAVNAADGNKSEAARQLGVHRNTIHRHLPPGA